MNEDLNALQTTGTLNHTLSDMSVYMVIYRVHTTLRAHKKLSLFMTILAKIMTFL